MFTGKPLQKYTKIPKRQSISGFIFDLCQFPAISASNFAGRKLLSQNLWPFEFFFLILQPILGHDADSCCLKPDKFTPRKNA
jgi:hypothetical protein